MVHLHRLVRTEENGKNVPDKKPDVESVSNVTNRSAIKEDFKEEGADAGFKNSDRDFSLENYLAEMTEVASAHKKARHKREVAEMVVLKEEEEAAMKARFDDWMKEYGRTYRNEEEKSWRYEIFKSCAMGVDKATANARGGARFIANHTADWTEEEFRSVYCYEVDWDEYLDEIKYFIAKKKARDVTDVKDHGPPKQEE